MWPEQNAKICCSDRHILSWARVCYEILLWDWERVFCDTVCKKMLKKWNCCIISGKAFEFWILFCSAWKWHQWHVPYLTEHAWFRHCYWHCQCQGYIAMATGINYMYNSAGVGVKMWFHKSFHKRKLHTRLVMHRLVQPVLNSWAIEH